MKKLAKDQNVLTDTELDRMMLTLEAAYAETGNKNVMKVLDIITEKPETIIFVKSTHKYPSVRDCSKCHYSNETTCNKSGCYNSETKEHGYYIKQ